MTTAGGPLPAPGATLDTLLSRLTKSAKLDVRTRFRILDVFLNCVLLTPLAVLFQVSACGVQDALFLNHLPGYLGTVVLLAVGFGIEFGCSFWQRQLSAIRYVSGRHPDDVSYVLATRLYHFAVGFANVCHYRGLSDIYYYLLGYGAYAALQATTTTVIALSSLKCVRNILGPPLCVGVDSGIDNFFETSTLFRTKEDVYYKHFVDHIATVTVVTSLCFLHWIAVWAFFDCIVYPQNSAVSVVLSWIVGYSIIAVAFLAEPVAVGISRRLEKSNRALKLVFEDAFLVACNCGVILVWRGHWVFFEGLMYYFPIYNNNVDVTAFYGIACSFLMASMLHASATLILKGCDFDGELPDGQGVSFGVDYFAEFFRHQIEEEEENERKRKRGEEREKKQQAAYQTLLNNNMTASTQKDKSV